MPMQSVPTSVAVGPDGAYYVGELTGFPFVKGAARVHRVGRKGSTVYATGFTNVTDIAFDRKGNLYVLEFAKDGLLAGPPVGAIHRIDRKGGRKTLVSEGLSAPTGIGVGRQGRAVRVEQRLVGRDRRSRSDSPVEDSRSGAAERLAAAPGASVLCASP